MSNAAKKRITPLLIAIKVILTLSLIGLLFTRIDPALVVELWPRIDLMWAVIAIVLIAPNLYSQYRRWRVGLVRVYPALFNGDAARTMLIGLAMGALTPGRIGELGQVAFLTPGGRRRALGVIAVMRVYIVLSVLLFGAIMLFFRPDLVRMDAVAGRTMAAAILLSIVVLAVLTEYLLRTLGHPRLQQWIARIPGIPEIFVGARELRSIDRLKFVLWSLTTSLVYLTQLVVLMLAFGAEVAWLEGVAAGAITFGVVAVLPITLGGIGVRESAAVLIWQQLGVPAAVAFNAAFLMFLINVIIPGAIGVTWNLLRGKEFPQPETTVP